MIGTLPPLLLTLVAPPDDRTLVERIRRSDGAAFRLFFDRHHAVLYRYFRRRGIPGPACEALVQNAFLVVWEQRGSLDAARSLRAHLLRIGYGVVPGPFREAASSTATEEGTGAPTPHDEAVRAAVRALPESRRAVFELCFFEELTYPEAADVLGVSIATVEHRMAHALKSLRLFVRDEAR